jgi:hypothetical protein
VARSPHTDRERKRLARLLLEDVTLLKTDHVTAHVRFKGGATRTLRLPLPVPIGPLGKTDPILAERDVHTGGGAAFARLRVREVRLAYKLRSRYERLPAGAISRCSKWPRSSTSDRRRSRPGAGAGC